MNPEEAAVLRLARLVLLLESLLDVQDGVDAERLGLYDFFAVHPLLLAREPDDPDRLTLRLAGFDDRALAYASAGQLLATAQQHLARDLTTLVRLGMVSMVANGRIRYRLTTRGRETAGQLTATYAHSYVLAARIVVRRLRRLSGRRLREAVRLCISAPPGYPTDSFFLPSKDTR